MPADPDCQAHIAAGEAALCTGDPMVGPFVPLYAENRIDLKVRMNLTTYALLYDDESGFTEDYYYLLEAMTDSMRQQFGLTVTASGLAVVLHAVEEDPDNPDTAVIIDFSVVLPDTGTEESENFRNAFRNNFTDVIGNIIEVFPMTLIETSNDHGFPRTHAPTTYAPTLSSPPPPPPSPPMPPRLRRDPRPRLRRCRLRRRRPYPLRLGRLPASLLLLAMMQLSSGTPAPVATGSVQSAQTTSVSGYDRSYVSIDPHILYARVTVESSEEDAWVEATRAEYLDGRGANCVRSWSDASVTDIAAYDAYIATNDGALCKASAEQNTPSTEPLPAGTSFGAYATRTWIVYGGYTQYYLRERCYTMRPTIPEVDEAYCKESGSLALARAAHDV
ncbi:hypothetical protein CYMTET_8122 [Cymbomonas tetramitiformis]|uniref:Uncharacterized protein n=1 Tax=Cymbomonas tetramitiformis TaxID=36881 RepID=A0AAE0GU56_9CHLO|nr:hypothetical protein CYMTET_8122 [Cymbomonas tetramitiformis]